MIDTLMLSRIQFASNITFHILFPTITIALGWFLFFFKLKFVRTQNEIWNEAYKFWVKIFALTFALGVVSGLTMSFQFGTNWPGYMEKVGNIAGPLLAYEVLTAFFLEATFLGVMLFGSNRVSQKTHLVATFLVAFGTTLSAFWIIALNSWMQTPQGHKIIDGIVFADSWWAIIFNPSMPYRLMHMMMASFLTAAFFVAGVSAYRSLKGSTSVSNNLTLKLAVTIAAILIPFQILLGDLHGTNTLEHQPAKLAAMEGIWKTGGNVPAVIFAIPDQTSKSNLYEIAIPNLASLYLTHTWDGEVKGLDAFGTDIPPVLPVFFAFRIMVGVGILMLCISWFGFWRLRREQVLPRWFKASLVGMTFSGWIAVVSGWYVTEIGRQPFLVSGILRTADAVTTVPSSMVLSTLLLYLILYIGLLATYIWIVFYMARKADQLPADLQDIDNKSISSTNLSGLAKS